MKIFNSLTSELENFETLEKDKVGMYACGPTVYDVPHLGHARSEVVFDLIRKYLEFKGYDVNYVHNYTDIDDKMIKRANEKGISVEELAEINIAEYGKMQKYLYVKEPTHKPRATWEIKEMIEFIQKLIQKDFAYNRGGNVYFNTESFNHYKNLFIKGAEKQINEESNGSEEASNNLTETQYSSSQFLDEKKNPYDFALWKSKKEGEPYWDSPWGKGRPGWHIECSVMSMKYVGETLDIHGGGVDLQRPHHQNEIAQSQALTGKPFAKYWVHNGFLNIDNEKMSKSLGNFITINDIMEKYEGKVIRYLLLSRHYRSPINFSMDGIEESEKSLKRIRDFLFNIKEYSKNKNNKKNTSQLNKEESEEDEKMIKEVKEGVYQALDNDFNTPEAFGYIFRLVNHFQTKLNKNQPIEQQGCIEIEKFLDEIDLFFNIFEKESSNAQDSKWKQKYEHLVDSILELRGNLRKENQWQLADRIRERLLEEGIVIKDSKEDSSWSFE